MKKLSNLFVIVGLVLLIGSLIWWQQTFGLNMDYLKCLVVKSGVCRVGSVSSFFSGASNYNPLAFIVGAASFIVGIILNKMR